MHEHRAGEHPDNTVGAAALRPTPLGTSITGASARTRAAVTAVQVAGLAADATRAVPGVAGLQPRLRHLARHWTTRVWTHATGRPVPDTAGITVRLHGSDHRDGPGVEVEITLVAGGRTQVAALAAAVQRAVTAAITAETGLPVHQVGVLVCDIAITATPTPILGER